MSSDPRPTSSEAHASSNTSSECTGTTYYSPGSRTVNTALDTALPHHHGSIQGPNPNADPEPSITHLTPHQDNPQADSDAEMIANLRAEITRLKTGFHASLEAWDMKTKDAQVAATAARSSLQELHDAEDKLREAENRST